MVYHCARCSNTGLTMHQLPSSLTSFFQPIYIPHPNHIYHIISCHYSTPSNFKHININLSSHFSIQYFTTQAHIFLSTISIITNTTKYQQYQLIITNSPTNISQHNHIYFINNFNNYKYNQISSTSTYHHKFSNQYLTT